MQAEGISCKKRLELCRGVGAKCERARTYEISCERSHFPLRRALAVVSVGDLRQPFPPPFKR
jgi:hypothetical protein